MSDRRQLPIVAFIGAAVLAFLVQAAFGGRYANGVQLGAIPILISQAGERLVQGQVDLATLRDLSRLATAIFVHADFLHLLYNMIMLWAFGGLIARYLGGRAAWAALLVCGICGNLVQVGLNQQSPIPIVGASGAITGLEGIYFGLILRWQLPDPDIWPLAHPIPPMQLGAFAIVGFLYDAYSLMNHRLGIAYGAHLGGFVAGVALAATLTSLYPTRRSWPFAA